VRSRRAPRLSGFDYSAEGAYFLTICAHRRQQVFARCEDDELRITSAGRVLERCWAEIPNHFPSVEVDVFVVMPNHVHGVLCLVGVDRVATLPVVVGSLKSAAAGEINALRGTPGARVWQRGYHERIVRDEDELEAIRRYVLDNPAAWSADSENPSRTTIVASAPWL
jgi:putative transposase